MAATCGFLLCCNWLRYLMSPAFQLVKDCFKMFVLFGFNPFYAGKTVPFVIYSLGREINFDKFSSSLIKYIFSQHVSPVYSPCSVLFAWTTGGCLLSQMNIQNLQKPLQWGQDRVHFSGDKVHTIPSSMTHYAKVPLSSCLSEYVCTELQCSP